MISKQILSHCDLKLALIHAFEDKNLPRLFELAKELSIRFYSSHNHPKQSFYCWDLYWFTIYEATSIHLQNADKYYNYDRISCQQ